MKKYLQKLYKKAEAMNYGNIFRLLEKNHDAKVLDLGCDDGAVSIKIAETIGTDDVAGVEIVEEKAKIAKDNGIIVKSFDLNGKFSFASDSFDCIVANQVIEHLYNSDSFLSEIYRVLKSGGYAIISTENASSWCNIFASIMGWQIFSLTNFSSNKRGIGNPLALMENIEAQNRSWNHVRVYNFRGLKDYFETFGFRVEAVRGAGYFPLPGFIGNIDKTHSHFMTFKIKK
jgi:2-polyprenyl-3-methyl-5-hydroxy-6-metoxy-1,4-benzoquinol methylase